MVLSRLCVRVAAVTVLAGCGSIASTSTDASLATDGTVSDGLANPDASAVADAFDARAAMDGPDAISTIDVAIPTSDAPAVFRCVASGAVLAATRGGTDRAVFDLPAPPAGRTALACSTDAVGPFDVRALTVDARLAVHVTTVDPATDADTVLELRRVCDDPSTALACNDDAPLAHGASTLDALLDPGTYALVTARVAGSSGRHVALAVSGAVPSASATCATAPVLTDTLTVDTRSGADSHAPPGCATAGPQQFVQVIVPPDAVTTVSALDAATVPAAVPVLRALDACAAAACLSVDTARTASTGATVRIANPSSSPRTAFVSVASSTWSEATFALRATTSPLAPGAECASAVPLATNTVLTTGSTAGGAFGPSPCSADPSTQLYYRATVPAHQRIVVRADGQVVRMQRTCTAGCLATSGNDVSYANVSDASEEIYVVVSTPPDATAASYTLRTSLVSPSADAVCANATVLASDVALTGQDLGTGTTAGSACIPYANGPQRFYSLTVAPGMHAAVTVTPTGGGAAGLVVRVLDACGATSCRAQRTGTANSTDALSAAFDNGDTQPVHEIIAVASDDASRTLTYSIVAHITVSVPPPYVLTRTPEPMRAGCEVLDPGDGGATVTTLQPPDSTWNDDESTARFPLPFAFRYFGETMMFASVSSNGFAQLWPVDSGTVPHDFQNTTLPDTGAPRGMLAVFWDDLKAVDGTTVRSATLGVMPDRRFVIEWNNWGFYQDETARLRFQTVLHETSGVIEYRYCSQHAGTDASRVTGSSATVGLQDRAGEVGIEVGDDRAGVVTVGDELRFTPR